MRVSPEYGLSHDAWAGYTRFLASLITERRIRTALELGGGANPALPLRLVQRTGLRYTLLDVSEDELAKAPADFEKIRADITSRDFEPAGTYDLVFSRMLAEHVRSGHAFHGNVLKLLGEGGLAFHFFPTLFALPFVVNRIVPDAWSDRLLRMISPRDRVRHGKFPAYYSWCRGPTRGQIRRFEDLGYRVDAYKGFFGHDRYYARVPLLRDLHGLLSRSLVAHPVPWLTSFAYVLLSRR